MGFRWLSTFQLLGVSSRQAVPFQVNMDQSTLAKQSSIVAECNREEQQRQARQSKKTT